MRNRLLILCGMVAIFSYTATSYFGLPNPSHLGLLSTLYSSGALVLLMLLCLKVKNSRLAVVTFSASCFIYLMLTVGNWWIFQYFRSYFNYEHLSFLRDGRSGLKSAADFDYISQSIWQVLISSFLLISFFLLRRCGVSRSAAVYAFFIFSAITVPAKIYIDVKYKELEKRNLFTLSPYIISPVHAFFYSYGQSGVGTSDGWSKFKSMNEPLTKNEGLSEGQEKLNIIILTLESFRSSFIGGYGSKRGLTPNFDKLAKKSFLFRNFYANSNFTIKGENAILCSFFDHNAKLSIAEYGFDKALRCLPHVLKELGYNSSYFHANHSRFYNRAKYFPNIGFDELNFYADLLESGDVGRREVIGWGVSDEQMYDYFFERVKNYGDRLFFSNVMTISAHYPFRYDWPIAVPNEDAHIEFGEGSVYKNYENAIFYSDYALGKFLERFEESGLDKNTILVVTGDHGVWVFDDENKHVAQKAEDFFRVPLLIYHPNNPKGVIVDQVASQVDIMPTVLALIGVKSPRSNGIGKDALREVKEPWAVMMKGGDIAVRLDGKICVPDRVSCEKAYQSCLTMSSIGVSEYNDSYKCYGVSDAVGFESEYYDVPLDINLLDQAFNMVAFENNSVVAGQSASASVAENPMHMSFKALLAEKDKTRAFNAETHESKLAP